MIAALLAGLVLGFVGSMPIAGPISALVVSRALEHRTQAALLLATGAALPEAVYAFLAFWGYTTLLSLHPDLLPASRVLGALILVGLGIYFAAHHANRRRDRRDAKAKGWRDALLGFTMTAANPTLLVTWTAAVGIVQSTGFLRGNARDGFLFAAGVAGGITGWFFVLTLLLERFRQRVNTTTIDRVIRIMGVVLVLCGLYLGARGIVTWGRGAPLPSPRATVLGLPPRTHAPRVAFLHRRSVPNTVPAVASDPDA